MLHLTDLGLSTRLQGTKPSTLTSSQKAHLLFHVWDAKTLVLDEGPSKQPEGNRNTAVHQLLLELQVNRREQSFPHTNTNPSTPHMHLWCSYHPKKQTLTVWGHTDLKVQSTYPFLLTYTLLVQYRTVCMCGDCMWKVDQIMHNGQPQP